MTNQAVAVSVTLRDDSDLFDFDVYMDGKQTGQVVFDIDLLRDLERKIQEEIHVFEVRGDARGDLYEGD